MERHFMAAPTLAEMGGLDIRTAQEQLNLFDSGQPLQHQMGEVDVTREQQMGAADQSVLTPEQEARLAVVMNRQTLGGGHLTDKRHMGAASDPQSSLVPEEEKVTYARAYYA